MLSSVFFAYKYEKSPERSNIRKLYLFITFLIVVCFSGFRYFVGNDYPSYVKTFYTFQKSNIIFNSVEIGYILLLFLFKKYQAGYFYLAFTCTFISYFFLFLTLCREKILKWGIFFIFTSGLLIFMNDGMRQGVAISIFIYATRFIKEKKFIIYVLFILLASCFHLSVLVCIPVYFLRNLRIPYPIWIFLLLFVYILQLSGIFKVLLLSILSYLPLYGDYSHSSII